MNGQMVEYSMEIGKIIRCKDMEHSLGQTGGDMLDNILMI